MKKPVTLQFLASLCFIASIGMYVVGSNSGHLTELKDFFWAPLPLGVIFQVLAMKGKSADQ